MKRGSLIRVLVVALAVAALGASSAQAATIHHVFTIVLENESAATTFAPDSPARYLSKTLVADGAYVPNYYGVGHNSLDNYIAMVSGQAPNTQTQQDCPMFNDFAVAATDQSGQKLGTGCVYPANIQTIASQLSGAGFTWRGYDEDMGNTPSRDNGVTCAHPAPGAPDDTQLATPADQYATRHNPFAYFHSIIDNQALCDQNVVNLSHLPQDLSSAATTPNYVFITPNLCNDGHDTKCANGDPGGLAQADTFLQKWVPQITSSPAFREDGLLQIIIDEAAGGQAGSCCGQIAGPGAPTATGGGGQVAAVLLSPCIAPGTVTQTPYNHYAMLRSVEDLFGLAHLGFANLTGESSYGSDVFNRQCGPAAPVATLSAPSLLSTVSRKAQVPLSWSSTTTGGTPLATYTVQERDLSVPGSSFSTVASMTQSTSLSFSGALGHTYAFQVQAMNMAGQTSNWASATTVIPSSTHPAGAHFSHHWKRHRAAGAWQGRAITTKTKGATLKLRYTGGSIELIGETGKHGGKARVTIDGRRHTVRFHSSKRHVDRIVFSRTLPPGVHTLKLKVLHGSVTLEGVAISSRTA